MCATASQITSLTIVYPIVYSDADQRKHQSSASLVFVRGIHRGPVNSPRKWPVTRKMFPFDDVIMGWMDIHVYCSKWLFVGSLFLQKTCVTRKYISAHGIFNRCHFEFTRGNTLFSVINLSRGMQWKTRLSCILHGIPADDLVSNDNISIYRIQTTLLNSF